MHLFIFEPNNAKWVFLFPHYQGYPPLHFSLAASCQSVDPAVGSHQKTTSLNAVGEHILGRKDALILPGKHYGSVI